MALNSPSADLLLKMLLFEWISLLLFEGIIVLSEVFVLEGCCVFKSMVINIPSADIVADPEETVLRGAVLLLILFVVLLGRAQLSP